MAVVLDGTNNKITFPDGSDTSSSDVLIATTYAENSSRQSANEYSSFGYWWEVSFTRQKTDSDIRVTGLTHMQGNHCYPYFGTAVRLVAPNGTTYLSDGGSHYFHTEYSNGNLANWTEKMWTAGTLNSQDGGWKIQFGWHRGDGSACKPCQIINYNSNEDGRAYQRGSTAIIREYKQ